MEVFIGTIQSFAFQFAPAIGRCATGTGPGSASIYSNQQGNGPVALQGVSNTLSGGNTPAAVMNPFLAVNFSLALNGIFPSRN